ncbi:TetR/AcrR family transcriptional regulator [Acerihabitans arboris]|uniref:TetR family transcriptional regulator n=1 Tax=Acerihabitans arboris TaxID=2691583 RepID=A0A845SNH0_9GAMM|nr:TetR/AcrR family transcriptional regulator [Acerihabitans arboris]NDL64932.1 TetR family transcriptional regulator [Acerihabitans arboris]
MARPKSEEKRLALLEAAVDAVAEHGLGASTARIAAQAGVAEGTLFRYFATKDHLLNELYFHLKQNLCNAMMEDYLRTDQVKERARSVWNSYIGWGLVNPAANKAMRQLAVSDKIRPATIACVAELFPDLEELSEACVIEGVLIKGQSAFADAIFMALAQTTMEFALREPDEIDAYKAAGFDVMWRAFTK